MTGDNGGMACKINKDAEKDNALNCYVWARDDNKEAIFSTYRGGDVEGVEVDTVTRTWGKWTKTFEMLRVDCDVKPEVSCNKGEKSYKVYKWATQAEFEAKGADKLAGWCEEEWTCKKYKKWGGKKRRGGRRGRGKRGGKK